MWRSWDSSFSAYTTIWSWNSVRFQAVDESSGAFLRHSHLLLEQSEVLPMSWGFSALDELWRIWRALLVWLHRVWDLHHVKCILSEQSFLSEQTFSFGDCVGSGMQPSQQWAPGLLISDYRCLRIPLSICCILCICFRCGNPPCDSSKGPGSMFSSNINIVF